MSLNTIISRRIASASSACVPQTSCFRVAGVAGSVAWKLVLWALRREGLNDKLCSLEWVTDICVLSSTVGKVLLWISCGASTVPGCGVKMCVCACVCRYMCICLWVYGHMWTEARGNIGCHSSVTVYLVFEIRSLAEIWGLPIRLSWQAGKPQRCSCTCQCGDYQPWYAMIQGFFMWALEMKLRLS